MVSCQEKQKPTQPEITDNGYRLHSHNIETQLPAFVNIMFQVTDMDGKGIDYLTTDDFEVREDDQPVSPTESAMQIRKKDVIPYTLKTVLLLDNSASVGSNLEEIKNAAKALVENITTQQQIAVYKFSDHAVLLQDFTDDVSKLVDAINSIDLGFASTDLYGSIIEGVSRWEDIYSTNQIQQGFLITLTDGSDTQGSYTLNEALNARGDKKIYTVGLGNEIDPDVLKKLGNAGFYSITDVSELVNKFKEIQSDMALYANSFYWLNYMSPKRGDKNHTLKLFVKNNINNGPDSYITGEFNSAGFYSVYSGLYINPTNSNPYGIDTLTIFEDDTISITAVTYLGNNPPQYQWSSGNESLIRVEPNLADPLIASVISLGDSGQTTTITVEDVANSLSKTIDVVITRLPTMTDQDGNVYRIVKIGSQWWMAENLKVTHYRNGDAIPNVTDDSGWAGLSTGAYCAYNNDDGNIATYGLLYNWYAVDDSRNIAPAGWHVPTDEEWKELEMYLGMSQSDADISGWRGSPVGSKLKATSSWNYDGNGTNESGFSALPGGYRHYGDGAFKTMGYYGYWWSSTANNSSTAWYRYLNYLNSDVSRYFSHNRFGFSVRLVRD